MLTVKDGHFLAVKRKRNKMNICTMFTSSVFAVRTMYTEQCFEIERSTESQI